MPPSGPFDAFNIRLSGPDGAPAFPMTDADYANIAAGIGLSVLPSGVSFEHHENGPDIGFDASIASAPELAASSARAWLGGIRGHLTGTDLTATLYPPGTDPIGRSPNFRFEMADNGAIGLAGFLVEMPAVSLTAIGDSAPTLLRSVAEIERHPMEWVEAGAYRVTIELPWGRWSRLVTVRDEGVPTRCEVPGMIGREPLRNAWLRSMGGKNPPALDGEKARRVAPGLAEVMSLIAVETGDGDRIEPFSRTALPEWDILFSAGRLDQVDEERIRQLAEGSSIGIESQERDLLLLGLGHAAFAQGSFDTLRTLLAQVVPPLKYSLDHVLLAHLLRAHDGQKSAVTQAENIVRHVKKFDRQVAAPIILGWTAGLLAPLFAKAGGEPPDWLTQLSANSPIAIRRRADADRVDAVLRRPAAAPGAATPLGAFRPVARPAGDAIEVREVSPRQIISQRDAFEEEA